MQSRIRDNQRRSRARQKEYIHELQEKVQTCERLGVQASLEIQQAARTVLEENKRLRALLKSRDGGAPMTDQDSAGPHNSAGLLSSEAAYLQEKLDKHGSCSAEKPGCAMSGKTQLPLPPLRRPITALPRHAGKIPKPVLPPSAKDVAMGPAPQLPKEGRSAFAPPPHTNPEPPEVVPLLDSTPPEVALLEDDNGPDLRKELDPTNNTSSCAFAISIITNMRGDVDTNEVREALNCCGDNLNECKVDNSRLFAAVDQFAE